MTALQARLGRVGTAVAGAVLGALALAVLVSVRGFAFDIGAATLGAFTGLVYGLLAIGLVLVFRSSKFINFAHGDIGFFGAAVMVALVTGAGLPYWVAFLISVAVAAAVGALTEATIVRRLRNAPRLMSMIATLLLGRVLIGFGLSINARAAIGYLYPQPAGFPAFQIGALRATPAHVAMLVLTPLVALGLVMFLRRSRFGLAIRAAASNPDAAAMSGVLPNRMAIVAWGLAGGLAAITAILWLPTRVLAVGQFGPSLLVRALAAAVIARMDSIPVAFGAGIALGIVEQVVAFNSGGGGEIELWLFVIILATLLLQHRRGGRIAEMGSWAAVLPWPALPAAVAKLRSVRATKIAGGVAAIALGAALLSVINNEQAFVLQVTMVFILAGVSIGVLTGLGGQLSLGQYAIAGVGAVAAHHLGGATSSALVAVAVAAVAGAIAALLIGLPALRLRGLLLAVTTLSFAVAAEGWMFSQPWAFGGGVSRPELQLFGTSLTTNRSSYLFALGVLVVGFVLARNLRRSSFGRTLVALRDNEDAARAFTIPATRRKIQAFAMSGLIAGAAGAVLAVAVPNLEAGLFPASQNIDVIALTLIGGVAVLAGPILGAIFLVLLADLLHLGTVGTALHLTAALVILLLFPNGLVSLAAPLRAWLIKVLSRNHADTAAIAEGAPVLATSSRSPAAAGGLLLDVADLRKAYGGVVAVDGVSLTVNAGETLGLIGPNGAGKTTLFELISGFVAADSGTIAFAGRDVTGLAPEARGRLGLIRSFQEASLFGTMPLLEVVRTAHERVQPSSLLRGVIGVDRRERLRDTHARELISLMGLNGFRDTPIAELSTGVRRLAEITCLLALEPTLLLLDEPAAGIAQRETEQLGAVLEQVKRHLGCSLVVIEHDLVLISEISDRVVAMDAGKIIASGTPAQVQADPRVAAAFLGGDLDAITRSGARPAASSPPPDPAPPAPEAQSSRSSALTRTPPC